MTDDARTAPPGNGGPPLDDDEGHRPPWGRDGIGNWFEWSAAKKRAFDAPYAIAVMRARRAEALGLTYDEYTLEILERGRYLNAGDIDRIAEIIRRRPVRY
ncbi:MAG TPA: hypothetical protein VIN06_10185 [Devosia sp.]